MFKLDSVPEETSFSLTLSETPKTGFVASAAKIVSEYDQEIPQSQTADNPIAPRGRAVQPL